MRIMFLNKAYAAKIRDSYPCNLCMYHTRNCAHIPTNICIQYGGFQNANEEIFKI